MIFAVTKAQYTLGLILRLYLVVDTETAGVISSYFYRQFISSNHPLSQLFLVDSTSLPITSNKDAKRSSLVSFNPIDHPVAIDNA